MGGGIVLSKTVHVLETDFVKILSGKPHLLANERALCCSFFSRLIVLRAMFVEK